MIREKEDPNEIRIVEVDIPTTWTPEEARRFFEMETFVEGGIPEMPLPPETIQIKKNDALSGDPNLEEPYEGKHGSRFAQSFDA